jgi:hypothetical protein
MNKPAVKVVTKPRVLRPKTWAEAEKMIAEELAKQGIKQAK